MNQEPGKHLSEQVLAPTTAQPHHPQKAASPSTWRSANGVVNAAFLQRPELFRNARLGLVAILWLVLSALDLQLATAHAATITVTNTSDSGAGSLRQAILTANASANVPDTINFSIAGAGPHTITPATPLPNITDPLTINGYSQSGASSNTLAQGDNAVLKILVLGTLVIDTTNSLVRGLSIRGIDLGVTPGPRGGNVVEGNFIGLDDTGTNALNSTRGVFVQTPNNRIGGAAPGARNLISGQVTTAVEIFETFASNNVVAGNYIGTDRSGTKAMGNGDRAVVVNMNASSNAIGGTVAGAGNLISGNLNRGITLDGANNVVQGNYIGTDATGTLPLGNARTGVEISGPGNTVGGTNVAAANIIAFNGVDGGGIFTTNGVDVAVGATGYAILGNSIFDNLGLGIDVNADGKVTTGYPTLTLASNNITGTLIRGTHTPTTTFRLELFSNPLPDPSGYGEGRTLLTATNIATDGGGNFTLNWPASIAPGTFLTATANGATEFSQARIVIAAGGPNSWTNSASGKWENSTNWSLRAAPYIGQSLILITNAGSKTVTSDAVTATSFPTTLTISNLVLSAPAGATNTLALSHGGTQTPLTLRSNLDINSGGALTIQNTAVRLDGSFGTGLRIDGSASLAAGLLQVTNDGTQLIVGNNGRGAFSVSDGLVLANYAIVGANAGADGTWRISGGTNLVAGGAFDVADSLTATGKVVVTGGRLQVPNAYVGLFGNGQLAVSNGVVECAGTILVASQDGAQGSFIAAGGTSTFGGMQVRESPLATGSVLATGTAQVLVNGSLDNRGAVTVAGGNFSVLGQVVSEQAGNSILVTGGQLAATNDNAFLTSVTVSNGVFLGRDIFLGNQKAGTFNVAGGVVALPGSLNGFNVGVNGGTGTLSQTGGQILLTSTDLNLGGLFSPAAGLLSISNGTTAALNLYVGGQGGGTGTVAVAGGTLIASNAYLGFDVAASRNTALVSGPGSLWSNSSSLFVGYSGPGNTLVVSNGAVVRGITAELGHDATSTGNQVTVSGAGAFLNLQNLLYLGNQGAGSRLVVSNGGWVRDDNSFLGYFSTNNEAVVTGPGSTWTNTSGLYVGRFRGGNRLTVTNGGFIFSRGIYIGIETASTNNRVVVDGGTVLVTNATGAGELNLSRGTNVFNAGLIDVAQLWVLNPLGYFEFNGGTLATAGTTNNNGRVFTVGNGTRAATLQLNGGTHTFANNLVLSSNATLAGTGTILGAVTNGGTISPGASAGRLAITGPLVLSSGSDLRFEIGGTVPGSAYDQLSLSNSISHAGTVTVQFINGFTPSPGQVFQLLTAPSRSGTFANISLPVLPAGYVWTNRFATDGSISVGAVVGPTQLINPVVLTNGSFQFGFTNLPGLPFTVLSATNVALPLGSWTVLGPATEFSPGQYRFTDPGATNQPQRFYRVRWP